MQASTGVDNGRDQIFHRSSIGNVDHKGIGLPAGRTDFGRHRSRGIGIDISHSHRRPFRAELARYGGTYSRARAGDKCDFRGEAKLHGMHPRSRL
ncbi:hypothetical protein D9M72_600400 [compost metagenome]